VYLHAVSTSALDGSERSDSRSGRFNTGIRASCMHWIGIWVNPKAGLDAVARRKIPLLAVLGIQLLSSSPSLVTVLMSYCGSSPGMKERSNTSYLSINGWKSRNKRSVARSVNDTVSVAKSLSDE
jgi:hypothetical protein